MIPGLSFAAPFLLIGLLTLPLLWWLLRAVPPAPIRRRFPGVSLLLGLKDEEAQTDKTPWWLLLLRCMIVAAAIIGFAGPRLNPDASPDASTDPMLIVLDSSWASARDWPLRQERVSGLLAQAGQSGREVALVQLTDLPNGELTFQAANAWRPRVNALAPRAFAPDASKTLDWARSLEGPLDIYWFSDGLERDGLADLAGAFQSSGTLTVIASQTPLVALSTPEFSEGRLRIEALRFGATAAQEFDLLAHGLDPLGTESILARIPGQFAAGDPRVELEVDLPVELLNRTSRFELSGGRHAGSIALLDDALQRRQIGLLSSSADDEGQALLSPLHYLREALRPTADLIESSLSDTLLASPDVLMLADIATLPPEDEAAIIEWVEAGGLLVRFAGPRLAASDLARDQTEALMPVRLRSGGRSVGGAMSWGDPKRLAAFPETSPFFGLTIPDDVEVSSQVVAQPDPFLTDRTIASLTDGTPLVTRSFLGEGSVVLFHVTANTDWSTLPISGLFVEMLERLAVSTRPARPDAEDLAGTTWVLEREIDAFATVRDSEAQAGIPGETLASAPLSDALRPGLYAGEERRIARNVLEPGAELRAASWPADVRLVGITIQAATDLAPFFLTLALVLLLTDALATLGLSGRLPGFVRNAALISGLILMAPDAQAQAQTQSDNADVLGVLATSEVTLGYVLTGDPEVDAISRQGLQGLSFTLFRRTSVEPAAPLGVDLETDELAFFPLLYWPITPNQSIPSADAYRRLNAYLRSGGMIVFDTRDAHLGGFGSGTPEGRRLQVIAAPLDIPPLEPVPEDHILTRTFYLLQSFPGRHISPDVWVEAAPVGSEQVEGMPFRDLNDGVTPVVIGGNDWAAAWAVDDTGRALRPVGRGAAGERQREIALRFGVNLVMHALSGNYKSDQVHVPALLDRLAQ